MPGSNWPLLCSRLTNGKDVFWAFIDLEKAYDTINRHGVWQMLRVYGVGGKLLKAVQSFYVDSRACVQVGNDVSEWFPVNVGLRQGCVSLWLFNVYMDGVVGRWHVFNVLFLLMLLFVCHFLAFLS